MNDAFDRDVLGKVVRGAWVNFAQQQPNPKPHHLLPWEELDEDNKEVDRQIGEAIVTHLANAAPITDRTIRAWLMGFARRLGVLPMDNELEQDAARLMAVLQAGVADSVRAQHRV